MWPPWASINCLVMKRPNPVPETLRVEELSTRKNLVKSRVWSSGEIPTPEDLIRPFCASLINPTGFRLAPGSPLASTRNHDVYLVLRPANIDVILKEPFGSAQHDIYQNQVDLVLAFYYCSRANLAQRRAG